MKLLYLANIRLPTEKAHGLQIMQNCEAFAGLGHDVSLWAARRVNTPDLRGRDPFAHYGVARTFSLRRLPCIDLLRFFPATGAAAQAAFAVQSLSYIVVAVFMALFTRADVYYSRDAITLAALFPLARLRRVTLAYEAHSLARGRMRGVQVWVAKRAQVFTTTGRLGETFVAEGVPAAQVYTAHDGFSPARFAHNPDKAQARALAGWPETAFVVGYVGRLQTLEADKGAGTLVRAIAQAGGIDFALVGGPDDAAEQLRAEWARLGMAPEGFRYVGQVPAGEVPRWLAAFDVGAIPLPFTEHFAWYASPMKLFEYMAAGVAVVASDLPSMAEVVTDGETALLHPPSDVDGLAAALARLRDDRDLCARIAAAGKALVYAHYTWSARAQMITTVLEHAGIKKKK
jgi:glycosyltransferase involved in cell wall biosynthesis